MKLFNIVSWLSSYIDQLHSKLHTSLLRMGGKNWKRECGLCKEPYL